MSPEIYKILYEKVLLVESKKTINVCCVCLQTIIGDKDIRNIDDEAEFILNSGIVVVEKLSQALKTLIGNNFSELLMNTICNKCRHSAITSYSFILSAKESADDLYKAIQSLEICFMDTPASIIQKCETMYVDINLIAENRCVFKRYYDKQHNESPKQACDRIFMITQYQESTINKQLQPQVADEDPLASLGSDQDVERSSQNSEAGPEFEPEPEHENEPELEAEPELEPEPEIEEPPNSSKKVSESPKPKGFKYFNCPDCKAGFNSPVLYERHRTTLKKCTKWQRGNFKCDLCDYSAAYKHHLRSHIDFKHKGLGIICEVCAKICRSEALLKTHLLSHSKEKMFPCQICGQKLKSALALKIHTSGHTGIYNYPCYICGERFKCGNARMRHIKNRHTQMELEQCEINYTNLSSEIFEKLEDENMSHLGSVEVEDTELRANDEPQGSLNLQENILKEVAESLQPRGFKYFNCPQCNAGFNSPELYHKHITAKRKCTRRNRGYYPCDQCNFSAVYKHQLRYHVQVKHEGMGFPCEECGKSFYFKTGLETHRLSHSGKNIFVCQVCGKKLKSALSLKNHSALHTGEKNHPCHICGERFRSAANRGEHVRRHHMPADPVQCEICQKIYKFRRDYLKHRSKHSPMLTGKTSKNGTFKCGECDFRGNNNKELREHTMSKHGDSS